MDIDSSIYSLCCRCDGSSQRWLSGNRALTDQFENHHWLVGATYPSEKYEFVNWDDDIPNGKIENVPNHQPVMEWCVKHSAPSRYLGMSVLLWSIVLLLVTCYSMYLCMYLDT